MENPEMLIAMGFMVLAAVVSIQAGSRLLLKSIQQGKIEEVFTTQDAAAFPITGSCVLFGLYAALKFIPKRIIGALLSGYLSIASIFALGSMLRVVTGPRFFTGVISVAVGAAYLYSKHWILNNVLAVSICITAISAVPINNFVTSAVLLIALFFYDIFWVFGTDVMVTVATHIDGPIKLLFPQTIFGSHDKKSLLGLGDIVIPGFFIAQCMVFSVQFAKRGTYYYRVAMVAYVASLLNTFAVMLIFNHAQPALLYIVPWLLISICVAALAKGDFSKLLQYDVDSKSSQKLAPQAPHTPSEPSVWGLIWEQVKELFGFVNEPIKAAKPLPRTKTDAEKSKAKILTPDAPQTIKKRKESKK